ncbi:hypothetical protein GCM10009789_41880 [Kribbella sancticallisti]|uniref:Homogentisate 1,2-dioxygenase n=1 Tax=Kribbella sancticallisti TaxID=460087 RepID=A0ABN2DT05_9ACTN
MKSTERKLPLGHGTARPQDMQTRGERRRLVDKGRLPDAGFAGDQEYPAGSYPGPRDQSFDRPPFGLPPDQHVWQYTT